MKKDKSEVGRKGEDVACQYLLGKGFEIVGRNYRKPWGEIDVICSKGPVLHFVEVKSVARENLDGVTRERNGYRPEDNVHPWKLQRLSRTIQTYLSEKDMAEDQNWQFDVMTVYLNLATKQAKVSFMENVVL